MDFKQYQHAASLKDAIHIGYFSMPHSRIKLLVDQDKRKKIWNWKALYRIPNSFDARQITSGDPLGYPDEQKAIEAASKWWRTTSEKGIESAVEKIAQLFLQGVK